MRVHSLRRLACGLTVTVLMTGTLATIGSRPAAAAVSSMRLSWSLDGDLRYSMGFDAVNTAGVSPGGYEGYYEVVPPGLNECSPEWPSLPDPVTVAPGFSMSELRMEIYSFPATNPCSVYNPRRGDAGVVVRIPGNATNNDLGRISVPRAGQSGTGSLTGRVLSRTATPESRFHIDIFQITGYRQTSTGYRLDAFSSGFGSGGTYTTGPLWDGQYLAFVEDRANNTKAVGFVDVNGATTLDIDLDVPCFGIDNCEFTGTVTPSPGGYHPVGPNRILDTRRNLGITGAVQPGDGRNTDPNHELRLETRLNHEFRVTGVGGVPAAGVSAVLLNLTATSGSAGGVAKVFPKPVSSAWYEDQSSFRSTNPAGPLIVWGAGEDVANQVLVPVGVGGRLRIENFSGGSVHLVADVVGWFDSSQPGQSGSGLTAITPVRFLDTRDGTGGPRRPFDTGETRALQVAGRGSVPADATAVVGTITGVAPAAQTFLTVFPNQATPSETSVLNVAPGGARPNLVTVGVGGAGSWAIYNDRGPHDVLFDATGYFRNGSGGLVAPVVASTLVDTQAGLGSVRQPLGAGEARTVQVTGRGGVPGDATAVYLSVTASFGTATSYLTVWNSGTQPPTSNLNWLAGQARSNLVLVPLGPGGTVQVANALGSVHVVADVVAYVR